jgi:Flp pilus assembly protein TadG
MKVRAARNAMLGRMGRQRGQVLLKILLVMICVAGLIFGVIDLSRAMWQKDVVTGLTREGSNLASSGKPLRAAATAVINDGASLNLATKGKVIITSVQNRGNKDSPFYVMTDQYSTGSLAATSKVGTFGASKAGKGANKANLSSLSADVTSAGGTIYVTEVFVSYSAVTPFGALLKATVLPILYDAAYLEEERSEARAKIEQSSVANAQPSQ